MVTERRTPAITGYLAAFVAVLIAPQLHADTIRLSDAAERGVFTVGAGRGTVVADGDRLRFDYSLPRGTAAGLWAKSFPSGLSADAIDTVAVAAMADAPNSVRVTLEIKGTLGTQRLPLNLGKHEAPLEAAVDWPAVGHVNEVVVAVVPTGDIETANGSLVLDVRFESLSPLRRLSTLPAGRLGGVVVAALAIGFVVGRLPKRKSVVGANGFGRDCVHGVGSVAIFVLGVCVYRLGEIGPLEAGWTAVGVAFAGAAVAEWWTLGLTGRHLSASELIRDALVTGIFAATTSSLSILQTPASWPDALRLSQTAAAVAVASYHAANAISLSTAGRHLGAGIGWLIAGTPHVVGGLLLLRADALMAGLGGSVVVGRAIILLAFNEIVANALSLATRRTILRSISAHVALLVVASVAVVSPSIADYGSGPTPFPRLLAVVVTAAASQAGLWAEVYLITGMLMDAIHGRAPSLESVTTIPRQGAVKGAIFGGTFLALVYAPTTLLELPPVRSLTDESWMLAVFVYAIVAFPVVNTIIESFDGSPPFFRRLAASFRDGSLYARGAVVGTGIVAAIQFDMKSADTPVRSAFGFAVGALAYAGVNIVRDTVRGWRDGGGPQPARVYAVQGLLGGCIGAAVGFYFDAAQVRAVSDKLADYLAVGNEPKRYDVRPLLSKWGLIRLNDVTGGVNLLFAESMAGVIEWSIPAWLFALNRTFLVAYFQKDASPIKSLFTRDGLIGLTDNMLAVFRWGLWMSPVIKSFLRPVGDPTWYNQDGAIRTLLAAYQDATLPASAFRAWSLQVFVSLLAYDIVRVAIWLDHMGLRVATLVNLSFIGMDRFDARLARFLSPAATARCVPEAVKRFTTWAPLLIPFYIPRGVEWDVAWAQSEAIQRAAGPGPLTTFIGLPLPWQLAAAAACAVACTVLFAATRWIGQRYTRATPPDHTLANAVYEVVLRGNGEVYSHALERGYDVTRRSYDRIDPGGRTLFIVDGATAWPAIGNFPADRAVRPHIESGDDTLHCVSESHGLRTVIDISLPSATDAVEVWTITVENTTDTTRPIKLVPYVEWVLNRPAADRGHTQYNRLFAEMEYAAGLHAVLAWDKHAKAMGILAADVTPEGFLTARVDFIGRARSVWTPRAVETLAFSAPKDEAAHPTLDPIGSLLLGVAVPPRGSIQVRVLLGLAADKAGAIGLVARHLQIPGAGAVSASRDRKTAHRIGHGEIPLGTPLPYCDFSADGRRMTVHTPFTPRPFDHTMSNAHGHVVCVTNRGLHTSASVNSQQNRLTPDWADTVTSEVPGEAIYLYDSDRNEWFSPTYHPLNDSMAKYETEYGVDGSAVFRMTRDTLETELTVFVPPNEPAGVYLLTVRNRGDTPRRVRVVPYFQIVLAGQPEYAGPLIIRRDAAHDALFFENPRNTFRTGPAFAAIVPPAERVETDRGRFFGTGRGVARPTFVERAEPDVGASDDRPVAAFLTTLDIPVHGERTVVVVLGQADDRGRAEAVVRRFQSVEAVETSLEETRRWWLGFMDTVRVATSRPEFDRYLDWLKYQTLAVRIWARRGFYQASGAFGFRDQLQDAVNLIWAEPSLARRQILLHSAQQFVAGDVVHWFHRLQDGRTGFVGRTHASDNLLWLPWAVVEYVAATGDESLLDERTPYLEADLPFLPLPTGKHGMGFDPLRSARDDTVYRHCLKAIDLVLDHRMGVHGLPLMGTGDWNDGLDEIGSQGRGESVWLGLFLIYILDRMTSTIGQRDGRVREDYYRARLTKLREAVDATWRGDRYLRAIHDDGTEIGIAGSGVWEIDALTAAWAVMAGVNPVRARTVFDTAVRVLERDTTILLGWPPLREDTTPYLGRSSWYPEGVRENGMYCHGDQWLVGAARLLAERYAAEGNASTAAHYRETAERLWLKVSAIPHTTANEIETYGGQPNQQAADMVTTFDPGRMIWNGYTGSAGWMFRQALEGVLGLRLANNEVDVPTNDGPFAPVRVSRDLSGSPLAAEPVVVRSSAFGRSSATRKTA